MRFMAMLSAPCASGDKRAHAHARRDEALADVVDAFDLVERRRIDLFFAHFQQIAQLDRLAEPAFADEFGIFAIGLVVAGIARALQLVDRLRFERVAFAAGADSDIGRRAAARSAFRRARARAAPRLRSAMPSRPMPEMRLVRPGKNSSHQRARKADGFEVQPAAIGRDHRDAHLGDDLQQARFERGAIIGARLFARERAAQAARRRDRRWCRAPDTGFTVVAPQPISTAA